MKYRNGFVSNSSSSSFIIGIGEITDMNKFTKWNINENIQIVPYEDLYNGECWEYELKGEYLTVDSFNGDEISIKTQYNKSYVILQSTGPTEEQLWNEEWEYYDYDVDLNDFDDDDVDFVTNVEKHGVKNFNFTYGAGRDG